MFAEAERFVFMALVQVGPGGASGASSQSDKTKKINPRLVYGELFFD